MADVRRDLIATMRLAVLGLIAVISSGCATMYVDNGLHDVAAAEYHHPPAARPVQLIFTFQTKGTANTKATDFLRKDVVDTVNQSQLFSTVSTNPVADGALLSITINNVPVTDDAFAKGFATGFTFGLVGNVVTDGYVCTIEYLGAPGAARITKTRNHAIHTTVGAKGAPPHATKVANAREAAIEMTRQVVANTLKDLSEDPQAGL